MYHRQALRGISARPQCWDEGRSSQASRLKAGQNQTLSESLRISQGGGEPCLHPKEEIFRVLLLLLFVCFCLCLTGIIVPQLGIKPLQSLNHWTPREVPAGRDCQQ